MARQLSNPVMLAAPQAPVDGRGIFTLARDPLVTDFRVGDFCINTTSKHLFGPKNTSNTPWPDNGLIRGANGWYALTRIVADGLRRVRQIYDWVGGEGAKPTTGQYEGSGGLVADIEDATDIRGPEGPEMLIDGLTAATDDLDDDFLMPTAPDGGENEKRQVVELFNLGAALPRKSIAQAEASTVSKLVQRITIDGVEYKRAPVLPQHDAMFRSVDRWTEAGDSDSVNGGYWELTGRPNVLMAYGGYTGTAYEQFDKSRGFKMHPTVVVFGDSNTAWVSSIVPGPSARIDVGQGSWPAYLDMYLNKYVYYAEGRVRGDGQPGDNLLQGLALIDTYFATYSPQIIIDGFGTNDIGDGRALSDYLRDQRNLFQLCADRGIFVVKIGIPWRGAPDDESGAKLATVKLWNAKIKELCDTYHVPFIANVWPFGASSGTYFAEDGVHFTDALNQALASQICAAIVDNYGLPNDMFTESKVAIGGSAAAWELPGIIHTYGKALTAIQTPDVYIRRFFPYCLVVPAGQEVAFRADGPGGAMVSTKSPGTITLNGADWATLPRQTEQFLLSVSSRMNGSSLSYRVGAKAGTDSIYILGVRRWHDAVPNYRVRTVTEVLGGFYTPGKVTEIIGATANIISNLSVYDGNVRGTDPSNGLVNVGSATDRNDVAANFADYIPPGFRFLVLSTGAFFRWNGDSQSFIAV